MTTTTHTVKANHTNGYVKIALCARDEFEATTLAAKLEAAGYWLNITVAAFTPALKVRRAA